MAEGPCFCSAGWNLIGEGGGYLRAAQSTFQLMSLALWDTSCDPLLQCLRCVPLRKKKKHKRKGAANAVEHARRRLPWMRRDQHRGTWESLNVKLVWYQADTQSTTLPHYTHLAFERTMCWGCKQHAEQLQNAQCMPQASETSTSFTWPVQYSNTV